MTEKIKSRSSDNKMRGNFNEANIEFISKPFITANGSDKKFTMIQKNVSGKIIPAVFAMTKSADHLFG